MMNKHILLFLGMVALALIFGSIFLTNAQAKSDLANQTTNMANTTITSNSLVDMVEVYHFHRTRQCPTCIRIGNLTELTLKTYFQNELDSGKLVFAHINVELPENAQIAEKYGATGSSLMIGVYRKDGSFSKEENTDVWYKMGNQEEYLAYMKGIMSKSSLETKMDLMLFLEAMGASNFPLVAAFFIGIMMALSPCPLVTNLTAIAYTSRKIGHSKKTFWVGLAYTLGRMFTYVALASMIVYIGVSVQGVSAFLQAYGEKFIGPLMILIGLVMLEVIKLDFKVAGPRLDGLKEILSEKGYLGSFLLGVVFALAFCPFSAVLFFGMLIPLALKFSDGILIPSAFAFATGLPVILMSLVLVNSASKMGMIMNKVQVFEKRMRQFVAAVFILAGIYYVYIVYLT